MSFSNEMTVTPVEQQLAHVPGGQMWKEEPPFIQHTLFYNYILHNPNTGIPNSSSSSSQKPSSADISETEGGIIDALVSKQPDKILKKNAMQRCNGLHLILLHFSDRFGLHLSDQLILLDSNALGSTLPDGRSCSDGSGALHLILPYFSTYVVLQYVVHIALQWLLWL